MSDEATENLELTRDGMAALWFALRHKPGGKDQNQYTESNRRKAARVQRAFMAACTEPGNPATPNDGTFRYKPTALFPVTETQAQFLATVFGPHEKEGWPHDHLIGADEVVEAVDRAVLEFKAKRGIPTET